MERSFLISILILMPFVAGILAAGMRQKTARTALVFLATAALALASLAFFKTGAFDYTPPAAEALGLLISVGDACLLAFFAWMGWKRKSLLIMALAVAQMVPLAWLEIAHREVFAVSPAFVVDWLAIVMVLLVSLIGSSVVVYALPYMEEHEHHLHLPSTRQPRFFFFLLIFLGAMNGLVLSNNLAWLYFFWEITTLCCVMLIGHDGTEEATTNSYRALWMNLIGGAAFMGAIAVLATQTHSLSVQALLKSPATAGLTVIPIALLCLAGFTKAAQMPFQGWLLGAMVAPTPVSALLHSSTMVKAGVYLIIRLSPAFNPNMGHVVALVGAFTFVTGAMLAISQGNAKRVLAYSTISNLGLIVACAGLNTSMAVTAAVMLVIFHAVSKALLFMAAGVIEQTIGSRQIEDMEGLVSTMPLTTAVTMIGILSMLLPPFGMLVAKWAAIEAAAQSPIALILFVSGSAFTVVFWTKWVGRLMIGSSGGPTPVREKLPFLYFSQLGLLSGAAVVLSVLVSPMMNDLILPAVDQSHGTLLGTGMTAPAAALTVSSAGVTTGSFPFIGLFLVLVVFMLGVTLMVQHRQRCASVPYMCGENVLEAPLPAPAFRSAMEQAQPISIGGYYFDRYFGEKMHTPWINVTAVLLLFFLLGLAIAPHVR